MKPNIQLNNSIQMMEFVLHPAVPNMAIKAIV